MCSKLLWRKISKMKINKALSISHLSFFSVLNLPLDFLKSQGSYTQVVNDLKFFIFDFGLSFAKWKIENRILIRTQNIIYNLLERALLWLSAHLAPSLAGTRHYIVGGLFSCSASLLYYVAFQPEMALVMHLVYNGTCMIVVLQIL